MFKQVDSYFELSQRGSSVPKELIGALITFLSMSYILSVQPFMLGQTGMAPSAIFTATAVASAIATIFMGLFSNLPIALSCGMGLNAVFTYQIVLGMKLPWQTALCMFLIEGIIALLLAFTNVRQVIVNAIPESLRKAIPVGIGMFIGLIALSNCGILVNNGGTFIGMGNIKSGSALLALIAIIITFALAALKVPGGILIGVVATTILGVPFGLTKIPEGFTLLSKPDFSTFGAVFTGFNGLFDAGILITIVTIISLTLSDVFDTLGTAFGVGQAANLIDKDGNLPKVKQMFIADSSGTIIGSLFGTSSVTSYIESGAGVGAGARTGLSSIFVGILFLIALFLWPVFSLIPGPATVGALFYVAYLMFQEISSIDFKQIDIGVPAFITIVGMPFFYSITTGIEFGILAYTLIKICCGKIKDITVIQWVLTALFLVHFIIG